MHLTFPVHAQTVRFGAGKSNTQLQKLQKQLIKQMPSFPAWNSVGIGKINQEMGLIIGSPSDANKQQLIDNLTQRKLIQPVNTVDFNRNHAPVFSYKTALVVFQTVGEIRPL